MKRFLAALAIPVAVLGFAACSDDDDDEPDTTTDTEPADDTAASVETGGSLPGDTLPGGITVPSLPDISVPDISVDPESLLRQVFPNLDDEQISCLADAIGDVSTDFDPSQVMDVLDDCNVNVSDLGGGG